MLIYFCQSASLPVCQSAVLSWFLRIKTIYYAAVTESWAVT